jgi:glutamate dehydrogenase
MTQRARVEAGLRGVRLNTDFIDNSAGVDTSDHEVNIKILLSEVEAGGELTRKQRDRLLADMTDEVAELVLRDNYLQTQSISVTEQLGPRLVERLARWMRTVEKTGRLDRAIEFLPDDEELADRVASGKGFTRPELSILLAYSKMGLFEELIASDLPDDPAMNADLRLYFPTALRDRYAEVIGRHRLRREIVATMVTNGMVNRVGPSFVHEVREKTGMPADDIARAYVIARKVFRLRGLWAGIESLDTIVPATVQAAMLAECGRLVERGTVWFLRNGGRPLEISAAVETYGAAVAELQDGLDELLSRHARKVVKDETKRLVAERVPEDLARRVASLGVLAPACDIVRVARAVEVPVAAAARTYFALGDRFGFDWLRRAALALPAESVWDKLAATAVVDDLAGNQATLLEGVLRQASGGDVDIARWSGARKLEVTRLDQLLGELRAAAGSPSFAMLAVANRQLKALSG